MHGARLFGLGLALFTGCAGETFDLLQEGDTSLGNAGKGGQYGGGKAGSAGFGNRAGSGGTGGTFQQDGGDAGSPFDCPYGNCAPACVPVTDPFCLCTGTPKNNDCPAFQPICTEGRCVACRIDGNDCAPNFTCDPFSYSCTRACDAESTTCPVQRPVCDAQRRVCVECLAAADCQTPGADPYKPICQLPTPSIPGYYCRGCRSNLECGDDAFCKQGRCYLDEGQD